MTLKKQAAMKGIFLFMSFLTFCDLRKALEERFGIVITYTKRGEGTESAVFGLRHLRASASSSLLDSCQAC